MSPAITRCPWGGGGATLVVENHCTKTAVSGWLNLFQGNTYYYFCVSELRFLAKVLAVQ